MTMKIWYSDLDAADNTFPNLIDADKSNAESLKNAINIFCNDAKAKESLAGPGYDSARNYLNAVYIPLLEERAAICAELSGNIKKANARMKSYMGDDKYIGDDLLPGLIRGRSGLKSILSGLEAKISSGQYNDSLKEVNNTIRNIKADIGFYDKRIQKIKNLAPNDSNAYISFIDTIKFKIKRYSDVINSLTPLTADLSTPVEEKAAAAAVAPVYVPPTGGNNSGSSSGSGKTTVPENNVEPTKTIETPAALVQTAISLVGLTNAELAVNSGNAIKDVDNYETGEDWNVKFINDVIRRNPEAAKLLEEYYNNPEKYPDPISSLSSLLKYSMEDDTNIEFNWSSGSIDTINKFNESNSLSKVTYTEYKLQAGDIIFLDSDANGTFGVNGGNLSSVDRTGIIESVSTVIGEDGKEKTAITVIEGDYGSNPDTSKVVRKVYDLDSKEIIGYGTVKEYKKETNTSNNVTGTKDPVKAVVETPQEPETPPVEEDNTEIHLKEGDSAGNVSGESGGTVDSEGVQRDSEGNVIGEVNLEKTEDGTVIVEESDIPSSNTKPEEDLPQEPIDMTDYSNEQGEYYGNIDPGLIEWDLENIDE